MPRGTSPPDELSSFVDLHYQRLLGALVLQCGSRELAEELAQDTIVRLCEHWDRVRDMRDPVGWVFRTAFNLSSSWFRRLQARQRALARRGADETRHEDADSADALAVREAVGRLPGRQRPVLILRYYLGYSPQEAAELLGMTNVAVRSATHRGLNGLREALASMPGTITVSEGADRVI